MLLVKDWIYRTHLIEALLIASSAYFLDYIGQDNSGHNEENYL